MGNTSSKKDKKKGSKRGTQDFDDVVTSVESQTSGDKYGQQPRHTNDIESSHSAKSNVPLVKSENIVRDRNSTSRYLKDDNKYTSSNLQLNISSGHKNSRQGKTSTSHNMSTSGNVQFSEQSTFRNLRRDTLSSLEDLSSDFDVSDSSDNDDLSDEIKCMYDIQDESNVSNIEDGKLDSSSGSSDDDDNKSEYKVSKLVIAAIDFGTTLSGYAYSLKSNYLHIYSSFWFSSGTRTVKAPTSVLFDRDQNFLCFGYKAEEMYNEGGDDINGCYFFHNFKMLLYRFKEQLNDCTEIEDNNVEIHTNSKMKAIDVFSAVIKYFKDELFKTLETSYKGITEDDIHWVLTVPAIWDLKAKQFMREAAIKAGISNDQLSLALEPEAASLYCRNLPLFVEEAPVGDKKISELSVGFKYLVLDLGGGTIDATVHEVQEGRKLKEVHQACGGEWGSNSINKEYYKLFCDIFGHDVMHKLHKENPLDLLDLMHDFETKKRSFKFEKKTGKERIKIPIYLVDLYQELNGETINVAIERTELSGKVRIERDKIFLQYDVICSLFERTISKIVSFLERMFQHDSLQDTSTLLAVGGFSKCKMLMDRIQARFPDLDIVVPLDAELAVLKGAIMYAIEPESIVCRVSQYTYGVPKMMPYNPLLHRRTESIRIGGRLMIDNIFDKHVEIGQVLNIGEFQREHDYFPVRDDIKSAHFEFCASEDKNPKSSDNCTVLGIIHFDLVRNSPKEGKVFLKINASGTELVAVIREESTNKEIQGYFSLI